MVPAPSAGGPSRPPRSVPERGRGAAELVAGRLTEDPIGADLLKAAEFLAVLAAVDGGEFGHRREHSLVLMRMGRQHRGIGVELRFLSGAQAWSQ
eukprot:4634023-Prymnesium_polylepis.1